MITMQSIVILYAPTWDAPSQMSKHHLARYWSNRNRVLCVESPPNPISFITRPNEATRLLKRYIKGPLEIHASLWVKSYFYPLPYYGRKSPLGARWVNTFNQRVVAPQLRRLLKRHKFKKPIVVIGSAHAFPLLGELSPRLVVYHCSDDYTRQDNFPRSFPELERDLLQHCDLVITTSEELHRAKAHLHPHIHTVTNGADVKHFARTQEPRLAIAEELKGLSRPIVGYIGSIFEWIDQDMIAYAAQARPEWNFVFIGPISTDISRLRPLSNVHFLGPRPYRLLPHYLKGFDVATVPFIFHDVTLRASPIKFYEYLASGVPIVATRLPDFQPFDHLTQLVTSPEEFVAGVEQALEAESPEAKAKRMREAGKHSWEARFAFLDKLIEQALNMKQSRLEG